jgi:hypothetical protein
LVQIDIGVLILAGLQAAVSVASGVETPTERIYVIAAESRLYEIEAESRIYTITGG